MGRTVPRWRFGLVEASAAADPKTWRWRISRVGGWGHGQGLRATGSVASNRMVPSPQNVTFLAWKS